MSFDFRSPIIRTVVALVAVAALSACTVQEYDTPPPSGPPVTTADGQQVEAEGDNEVASAPPAPQAEAIPAAPSPNHVWIAGHWVWQGRWVWAGGRWAIGSQPGAAWVPGHWHHGPRGRYTWIRGHWR